MKILTESKIRRIQKKVPYRHFVFSIPKILRRYFLYGRKLLADLSRCAWESLKVFLYPEGHKQDVVPENEPIPGAVIAVQTFGDFLGFNPHLHILVSDECFYGDEVRVCEYRASLSPYIRKEIFCFRR